MPKKMFNKLCTRWVEVLFLAALAVLATPISAQTPPALPLAGMGPYSVGVRIMDLKDASRDGRDLLVYVWYPAIAPETPTAQQTTLRQLGWFNATPDPKAAPYPVIVVSPGFASSIQQKLDMPLASQGFAVMGLSHSNDDAMTTFVDRPLDVLFALDQLAAANQVTFSGLIDTDHVGVMGFATGAYTALSLTGARVDPASATTLTAKPMTPGDSTDLRGIWPDWNWDTITTYRAKFSPPLNGNELWPPFTDKRIRAALMFSICWIDMFGERGLKAATLPSLIVGSTDDSYCLYEHNDTYAFAHLGSKDRYLLTLIKGGHLASVADNYVPVITQMDKAFFGYYLQGQNDYAQYLTAQYVDSVEAELKLGLVWGPYTGK